jgi:hypothetical protein
MKSSSLRIHWKKHIDSQEESGLSVKDYCFNNQLKACNFYIWRKKFSKANLPSSFTKIKIRSAQTAILSFGLTRLELPTGTDLDALAELMLKLNGKL